MKKYISIILIGIIASCAKPTLFTPAAITNNPLQSTMDIKIQEIFTKHQKELNTIGLSIGIYKNDSVYFYGYGENTKGAGIVPKSTTNFEMGSISKTFTTIAILNMLQENNQTINEPIGTYLPKDLPTLQRDGIEITFQQVLTHTSGLPYFPDNFGLGLYGSNIDKSFANYSRNKLFSCLKNVRLNFKPGDGFEYSNTGMGLMGTILELNYNKTYDEIIKQKILTPLSLNNIKTKKAETNENDWATGYNSSGAVANYWESLGSLNGAGCIKTNMIDLVNYGIANIAPSNSALGAAMLQAHTVSYLPFEDRGSHKLNGRLGWFQFINYDLPNESFIWHNGGTGGFNTELFINKNKKTVLAMFFNRDGDLLGGRDKMINELLTLINK